MAERLQVLVVEDSEDDALLVQRELRRAGWDVDAERVDTADAMATALASRAWDVVLADYSMPRFGALEALALVRAKDPHLPFIIVSGVVGEETAVAAMKAGAHDYVMKGSLGRLAPAIQRELREAEDRRALASERAFSTLLVERANALIVGLGLNGQVTSFNRAAERLTGRRREDVIGRDWFDTMIPEGRRAELRRIFTTFVRTGTYEEHEAEVLTAGGESRVIMWRNSVVRQADAVVGVVRFGIDVTDRRRAEAERDRLALAARRTEKLAALGTLAAGLAHELNNPIGIMSSRIELMLLEGGDALPEGVREDLRVLHRQTQRISRTTHGLLAFARRSSGERAPMDLNHIVRETLLLVENQMVKSGIRFAVDLAPERLAILGDADTLQQVVLNLVTNARDAMSGGGDLGITTRARDDGQVEMIVADTGPGIAPDDLARIFDPFFTTKPGGTGLGLSITHGIVTEHEGTIDVDSAPGRGTRFILTFPALVAPQSSPRDL